MLSTRGVFQAGGGPSLARSSKRKSACANQVEKMRSQAIAPTRNTSAIHAAPAAGAGVSRGADMRDPQARGARGGLSIAGGAGPSPAHEPETAAFGRFLLPG